MKPTAKAPATVDSAITAALLRRLKTTSISDDEDEAGDSSDMISKKHIIRRRKNLRLIEKKKQEGEAKDSVTTPSDTLPPNRRLSNHHDFLSVQMILMDLEEMVVRKDWSSPIDLWVFRQFEKGSKAHTAFHVFLKSGQGLQLNTDIKCFFLASSNSKRLFSVCFSRRSGTPLQLLKAIPYHEAL